MTCSVLLVCGSLQAMSANRAVLDIARREFSVLDDVTISNAVDIGSIPAFNPDTQHEPPPAVVDLRAQIARSDAVLVATPEYAGSLPGALKNGLDWVVGSGELYAKPVAVISAGTSGGPYARQHLIRTLTWQGAHVVAQLGIAAPRAKSDSAGRIVDPETMDAVEGIARKLVRAVGMGADDRLELVRQVTADVGVEAEHIAPVPQP